MRSRWAIWAPRLNFLNPEASGRQGGGSGAGEGRIGREGCSEGSRPPRTDRPWKAAGERPWWPIVLPPGQFILDVGFRGFLQALFEHRFEAIFIRQRTAQADRQMGLHRNAAVESGLARLDLFELIVFSASAWASGMEVPVARRTHAAPRLPDEEVLVDADSGQRGSACKLPTPYGFSLSRPPCEWRGTSGARTRQLLENGKDPGRQQRVEVDDVAEQHRRGVEEFRRVDGATFGGSARRALLLPGGRHAGVPGGAGY